MSEKEKPIAMEYAEMSGTAQEITVNELAQFPLNKHETINDRLEKHRIDMITMYEARFGNRNYETAWKALTTALVGLGDTKAVEIMAMLEIDFHINPVEEVIDK